MDGPIGKDSFVDADRERSIGVSPGMGVLYRMGGFERLSRNVTTVPKLADADAQRELEAIRNELYRDGEDAFKYYPHLQERLEALVQAHGRSLQIDIDLLVVRSLTGALPAELATQGEALITDLQTRSRSGDASGFAATQYPLTADHFRRHQGIAHNNVAHYWHGAGDIERAVWHQEQAVAILNETGGLGVIPAVDRRYALAALLLEYASEVYGEARRMDEELQAQGAADRLAGSELEYPLLEMLAAKTREDAR